MTASTGKIFALPPIMLIENYGKKYSELLKVIKDRINTAQVKDAISVNSELVLLYWEIAKSILESQAREGWGTKVIERLSIDLRKAFPAMKGFTTRNLK